MYQIPGLRPWSDSPRKHIPQKITWGQQPVRRKAQNTEGKKTHVEKYIKSGEILTWYKYNCQRGVICTMVIFLSFLAFYRIRSQQKAKMHNVWPKAVKLNIRLKNGDWQVRANPPQKYIFNMDCGYGFGSLVYMWILTNRPSAFVIKHLRRSWDG